MINAAKATTYWGSYIKIFKLLLKFLHDLLNLEINEI